MAMSTERSSEKGGSEAWKTETQAGNLAIQLAEESRPFGSKLGSYLEKLGSYLLRGSAGLVLITGIVLAANIAMSDPETILNHPIRQVTLPIFKYSLLGTGLGAWIYSLGVSMKDDSNC